MRKIGIIGAMEVEVSILKDEMAKNGGVKQSENGSLVFYEGSLKGMNVVVVKSGVGKVNAALCAQRLILQYGVDAVINSGIAGAMAKELKVFDMVASTDAVYHDVDASLWGYKVTQIPQMKVSEFPADKTLVDAALKAFAASSGAKEHKIITGRVASGDQFIADAALKAKIEANCAPACVEMEGAAIAHACYMSQISFLILRCVSDNADASAETTYNFNEKTAAEASAAVVLGILEILAA